MAEEIAAGAEGKVARPGRHSLPRLDLPEPIDLTADREASFRRFRSRWTTYAKLTQLDAQPTEYQTSLLVYAVGADCAQLLESAGLDSAAPSAILEHLSAHCIGERNVIYERYLFNRRAQRDSEDFDCFYAELRSLASRCQFRDLADELLGDCIVMGIRDDGTRQRLIATGNALTLAAAVQICRSEEVAGKTVQALHVSTATAGAASAPQPHDFSPADVAAVSSRHNKGRNPARHPPARCKYCGTSHPAGRAQ